MGRAFTGDTVIGSIVATILVFASTNPRHPLHKDPIAADHIATEIIEAAERFNQDPHELLAWGVYESSLRPDKVGDLGEVGYMQAHGEAARECKAVSLEPGSFKCGAYLWTLGDKKCGDHYRALLWYSSGKCNGTPRAIRIVDYRLWNVKKWKRQRK